jgi:S1-C subfamily serine protease
VRLRSLRPGDSITLTVLRDGQKTTVPVTLAERPTA